jgi:translation initiation factor IF-3
MHAQRRPAGSVKIKTIDDKIAELPVNGNIQGLKAVLKRPEGGISEPLWIDQLLDSINQDESGVPDEAKYLLQINKPDRGQLPIVQIVTRQELVKRLHHQETVVRNQQRSQKEKKPKQLEMNWAISANDLMLKMKQMQEFLDKGKKVELLLANKRHQRKATPEEAEALLQTVRNKIEEFGAAEIAPMDGEILRQALLTVKKKETKNTQPAKEQVRSPV